MSNKNDDYCSQIFQLATDMYNDYIKLASLDKNSLPYQEILNDIYYCRFILKDLYKKIFGEELYNFIKINCFFSPSGDGIRISKRIITDYKRYNYSEMKAYFSIFKGQKNGSVNDLMFGSSYSLLTIRFLQKYLTDKNYISIKDDLKKEIYLSIFDYGNLEKQFLEDSFDYDKLSLMYNFGHMIDYDVYSECMNNYFFNKARRSLKCLSQMNIQDSFSEITIIMAKLKASLSNLNYNQVQELIFDFKNSDKVITWLVEDNLRTYQKDRQYCLLKN